MKQEKCKKCFFYYRCIIQIGKRRTEIPLFNFKNAQGVFASKRKMLYLCSAFGKEIKNIPFCFKFKIEIENLLK